MVKDVLIGRSLKGITDSADFSLEGWPHPDLGTLAQTDRDRFLRRKGAVTLYPRGNAHAQIYAADVDAVFNTGAPAHGWFSSGLAIYATATSIPMRDSSPDPSVAFVHVGSTLCDYWVQICVNERRTT